MIDVTIIVPIFNAEVYLEKCLNTLANQDYDKTKLEILAIDYSSSDKSKEK